MTIALDAAEVPLSELEAQLAGWVERALDTRYGTDLSIHPDATPSDVRRALHRVRVAMDAVEPLLVACVRARGRARRATKDTQFAAESDWNAVIGRMQRLEYQGPRERYAEASLQTFEQQRLARTAERLAEAADTAYEAIRTAHQGLNSYRQDLRALLHGLQFESTLER